LSSCPLTFSCEKAKKVLGYEVVETLEEGIRRGVDGKKGMKNKSGMIRMIAFDKDEWMIRFANGMDSHLIKSLIS
jgi:hypothetical protein